MEQVEWRVIPEYPDYEVTRDGRVRSIDRSIPDKNGRVVRYKSKELNTMSNNKGYKYVPIKVNGKQFKLYLHRAVAFAYIPNPLNKPCINHIDNNPLNNNVENLEWCTKQENTDWMVKQGRNKRDEHWQQMQLTAHKKMYKPITATDVITGEQTFYESVNAVKRDGYQPSNVSIHARDGKEYRGKWWRYAQKNKSNEHTKES